MGLKQKLNRAKSRMHSAIQRNKLKIGAALATGLIAISIATPMIKNQPVEDPAKEVNLIEDPQKQVEVLQKEIEDASLENIEISTKISALDETIKELETQLEDMKTQERLNKVRESINTIEEKDIKGETLVEATEKIEEVVTSTIKEIESNKEAESNNEIESNKEVESNAEQENKKENTSSLTEGINDDMTSKDKMNRILINLQKLNIHISAGSIESHSSTFAQLELLEIELGGLVDQEHAEIIHESIIETQLNLIENDVTPEFSSVDKKTGYTKCDRSYSRTDKTVKKAHINSSIVVENSTGIGSSIDFVDGREDITIATKNGLSQLSNNQVENSNDSNIVNEYLNNSKNAAESTLSTCLDVYRDSAVDVSKTPTGNYVIKAEDEFGSHSVEIDQENLSITRNQKYTEHSSVDELKFKSIEKAEYEKFMEEAQAKINKSLENSSSQPS